MSNFEATIFCRYILSSLDSLVACLDGLNQEQLNWRPDAPHTNSLYVLAVHTLANTEENILCTIAGQPGTRDREQEFLARGASAEEIKVHWQMLRPRLQVFIESLTHEEMLQERQHPRRGVVSALDILIIVARHCAEHLGHAELTRVLLLAAKDR